ncbi:hypothetical protein RvY_02929 [Ramazzottius varieornatus]|uniref:Uncharacterized protein n=1 Tax=Ramazzottius varieornatus TaxID=947166 RepID=A0A1D1UVV3_RAMVA|nr:hypothetical protein RvY_02929 [Ramazzottius varieornatus]
MTEEEHSEEIEKAIWRMHRRGDDVKRIMANLKFCELIVSRKYINMAIKRVTVQMKDYMQTDSPPAVEELDEGMDDSPKTIDAEMTEHTSKIENGIDEEKETQLEVEDESIGDAPAERDEEEPKKSRRIKTTNELVEKLQEDFRLYPDTKVKIRAAKFGIAVGTLCQIKHNILKMPKESGRTWKSTPQMVEGIACHMRDFPEMKVKDRAKKFGISVGTLCRIMHDILELPKRSVTRTTPRGGGKVTGPEVPRTVAPPSTLKVTVVKERKETVDTSSQKSRKRKKSEPAKKPALLAPARSPTKSITQMCQLQLNGEGTSQMFVLTFDAETAAQLSNEGSVGLQIPGNDDIVWVVNSPSAMNQGSEGTVENVPETEREESPVRISVEDQCFIIPSR